MSRNFVMFNYWYIFTLNFVHKMNINIRKLKIVWEFMYNQSVCRFYLLQFEILTYSLNAETKTIPTIIWCIKTEPAFLNMGCYTTVTFPHTTESSIQLYSNIFWFEEKQNHESRLYKVWFGHPHSKFIKINSVFSGYIKLHCKVDKIYGICGFLKTFSHVKRRDQIL